MRSRGEAGHTARDKMTHKLNKNDVCLECGAPITDIDFGQVVCTNTTCEADWASWDHYYMEQAEMWFNGKFWQLKAID